MHWEFGVPFVQNQKEIWTIFGKIVKDATVGKKEIKIITKYKLIKKSNRKKEGTPET